MPRRSYDFTRKLNPQQLQLVLGTLLGDGSTQFKGARFPRYYITHGAKQAEYCRLKAEILKDFVRTPPQIRPNKGWGVESCVFSTLTDPAFEFTRSLCYRKHKGRFVKHVTKAWLRKLNWEGIAYWYLDDGSIAKTGSATISTHGFTRTEVDRLVQMLRKKGVAAKSGRVRKGKHIYWITRLNRESTKIFIARIRSYVPLSMSYKLTLPPSLADGTCPLCAKTYLRQKRSDRCSRKECMHVRRQAVQRRYTEMHRTKICASSRSRYRKNLTVSRRKGRELARRLRKDPRYRSRLNLYKREWRLARRLANPKQPVLKSCAYCGKTFEARNGALFQCATPCCPDTMCQRKRRQEASARYISRHHDRLRAHNKELYWKNVDRMRAYKREWARQHYKPSSSGLAI